MPWAHGTGRYDGAKYVVSDAYGRVIVTYMRLGQVGRGSYRRRIGTFNEVLDIPSIRDIPRILLRQGLEGWWQVGDRVDRVFATELPEGAELYEVPGEIPAADQPEPEQPQETPDLPLVRRRLLLPVQQTLSLITAQFGLVRVEGYDDYPLFYYDDEAGQRHYLMPSADAPTGSDARLLAELLTDGTGPIPDLLHLLRKRAQKSPVAATFAEYQVPPVLYQTIRLGSKGDVWEGVLTDGTVEAIDKLRPGDEQLNLRHLLYTTYAVDLSLCPHEGQPLEVVGWLKPGGYGHCLTDDPLRFVLPVPVAKTMTFFPVVKHEQGYAVYAFTVANRTADAAAQAAVEREARSPMRGLQRRPVALNTSRKPRFWVLEPALNVLQISEP